MTQRRLHAAIRFALLIASASLISAPVVAEDLAEESAAADLVTTTGSRIAHAVRDDVLPIQVIDRAEIEASGDVSVAELLRDSTLAAFGNFRPQSGSTAQSTSDIQLRGLGSERTLVLIDGRRVGKGALTGEIVNLNLIPIGAVERIEILPEGASAIYGSDALGGVVNIIMRKDFQGAEIAYMRGNPSVRGGDIESASATFGAAGDRGRLLAAVSYNERGIVFTRDQLNGDVLGLSTFGNNYRIANAAGTAPTGAFRPLPGFHCSGTGTGAGGPADLFFETNPGGSNNICSFNFNGIGANEASTDTSGLYTAADYGINDNWSVYLQASATRNESFGRYAPSVAEVFVPEGSPNDPVPGDGRGAFVRHRFAAVGPRDTFIDENAYDVSIGFKGRVADVVDVEFGARRYENQAYELGRNNIVGRLAEQSIADGVYDLRDPFGADRSTLDSISATTNRDAIWQGREVFGTATYNPFELAGGASTLLLGAEWRDEDYADIYDSLQSAGEIDGESGNSAGGGRTTRSAFFEWLFPITDSLDLSAAGRYDDLSDVGSEFSPRLAIRWRPLDRLTVRGSWGQAFVAPSLHDLNAQNAYSADAIVDLRTCQTFGRTDCAGNPLIQVDSIVIANPNLRAEQSEQFGVGASYDVGDWLQISAGYYRIDLEDRIVEVSAQVLVDRDNLELPLPSGLILQRDPSTGAIQLISRGLANEGGIDTDGIDFGLRTRFDFEAFGTLVSQLHASHIRSFEVKNIGLGGATITSEFAGQYAAPDLRARLSNQWTLGDFDLHWQTHFIAGTRGDYFVPKVGGYSTHDLQLSWKTPWNARIAVGATNIGDKYPSSDSAAFGRPWNYFLYDIYGRTPYLRYTQTF